MLRDARGNRDRHGETDHANQLDPKELLAGEPERARAPRQREHGHEVEDDERRQRHQRAGGDRARVLAKHDEHRDLHARATLERRGEDGRLGDRQAHVEADDARGRRSREMESATRMRRSVHRRARPRGPGTRSWTGRTRAARQAGETSRTTRACRAARSRSPGAPLRPTPRPGPVLARSGTGRGVQEPRRRSTHRSAAPRSRRSRRRSSRAPPRASSCGRRGHRSGRRAPTRSDARETQCRTWRATQALRWRDRTRERRGPGTRAPRPCRRCRSRSIRWWCR